MQDAAPASGPPTVASPFSSDWFRGVRDFNRQMFPLFPNTAVLFVQFALNYAMVAKVLLPTPQPPEWKAILCGGISGVLLSYLLRVFDEIKDHQSDVVNFPDRPLVRGPLGVRGATWLWMTVVAALLLLQLPFLGRAVMTGFLIALGYSLLSFKWFFLESKIRASLPLALVTHNPVAYLYQLYLLSFFGLPVQTPGMQLAVLFVVGDTLAWTAWEIARKIRGTEQEDAYTTYSKIWGPTAPTLLVGALLSVSWLATLLTVRAALGSNQVLLFWIPPALALALYAFKARGFLRDPRRAPPFRSLVEGFKLAVFASAALTLLLGVA